MRTIVPEPLTADAFAPFGDVIEVSDQAEVIPINYGWTTRFNALTDVAVGDGQAIISIFRSRPLTPLTDDTLCAAPSQPARAKPPRWLSHLFAHTLQERR